MRLVLHVIGLHSRTAITKASHRAPYLTINITKRFCETVLEGEGGKRRDVLGSVPGTYWHKCTHAMTFNSTNSCSKKLDQGHTLGINALHITCITQLCQKHYG
jgi:hypothetical protein